jgi:hypothetical protein
VRPARTHCKRGHAVTPDNVYVTSEGHKRCRACCRMHQRDTMRRADPRSRIGSREEMIARIERFAIPVPEAGCWLWTGRRATAGYGVITGPHQQKIGAHRAAFEAFIGPIPDGLLVCHKCDTPACCNPQHLFLGTHKDNMQDMALKGRRRSGWTREARAAKAALSAQKEYGNG